LNFRWINFQLEIFRELYIRFYFLLPNNLVQENTLSNSFLLQTLFKTNMKIISSLQSCAVLSLWTIRLVINDSNLTIINSFMHQNSYLDFVPLSKLKSSYLDLHTKSPQNMRFWTYWLLSPAMAQLPLELENLLTVESCCGTAPPRARESENPAPGTPDLSSMHWDPSPKLCTGTLPPFPLHILSFPSARA
jgi:hypothetical protein